MRLVLSLLLVISVISHNVTADTFRARIVKTEGEVYVLDTEGEKRSPDKKKNLVNDNETVVTGEDSRAVVQFDDGAMSVLDERSELMVEKSGWLSQLGGKVYYIFRKVLGKDKKKKVKTGFATIGIRGTTFIVDVRESNQHIALQEGLLNIESPGDDYEIHRPESAEDDFAAFKRQAMQQQQAMQQAFSDYKKQIADEFVEYKKSFELSRNQVVSFTGNKVQQTTLDQNWSRDFERFSAFSIDYIQAYRELDREMQQHEDDLH